MSIVNYLTYAIVLPIITILQGCSNSSEQTSTKKTGHFIVPFDATVQYQCDSKKTQLENNGKFECHSFPINFYIDSEPIGYITSIHEDGFVFPQDMIHKQHALDKFIVLAAR